MAAALPFGECAGLFNWGCGSTATRSCIGGEGQGACVPGWLTCRPCPRHCRCQNSRRTHQRSCRLHCH